MSKKNNRSFEIDDEVVKVNIQDRNNCIAYYNDNKDLYIWKDKDWIYFKNRYSIKS